MRQKMKKVKVNKKNWNLKKFVNGNHLFNLMKKLIKDFPIRV